MGYRSTAEVVVDLERSGRLCRIETEIDPDLEAAEIHRRVHAAGGPALYFARVKGSPFPMVSNLFGTAERARYLFRDTLESVRKVIELKVDPGAALRRPWRYASVPFTALKMLPRVVRRGPVLANETRLSALPQLRSWPLDGGPFVTLPQVYTEDPGEPGSERAQAPSPMRSNLGMYRVQLAGEDYEHDAEVGLHYQLHRGIGVHHSRALARGEPLPVNIFVGGHPAMSVAAVMPLPEGLSELAFAGALSGRRVRMARPGEGLALHAEADFCISGFVEPGETRMEGPFGDHLGYYSLRHPFPVLKVQRVYHRTGAVWPFTVVGRPPQEDTAFGDLIHELTGPVIPTVLPGVRAVHAVDASGVHPLLLAMGSERYVPYQDGGEPQELLTQANAILGQGQMSLAKYLFIADEADAPDLPLHDIAAFTRHVLERFDPERDLHFHTRTTIDTLDYSGSGFNQGSKLVIAARGPARRALPDRCAFSGALPAGFADLRVCLPGVLAVSGPAWTREAAEREHRALCERIESSSELSAFPLVVLVDDAEFVSRTLENFLWVTFTRSDPARDVSGVGASVRDKHWGCRGAVLIDARIKDHHAPPLEEDPGVSRRVDDLAAPGGPLHGLY